MDVDLSTLKLFVTHRVHKFSLFKNNNIVAHKIMLYINPYFNDKFQYLSGFILSSS